MELNAYEREHNELLRRLAPGCTLFLRRSGAFPLPEAGKLALYGGGARHTIKGGTGSGDVNSRFFVTAEQGLRDAGFTVTTDFWLDCYDSIAAEAKKDFIRDVKARAKAKHSNAMIEGMGAVMPEPEYNIPLRGAGDTAVYVLRRVSGEGNDRQAVPGDILLSDTEKRDILALNRQYKNFLLVLNVGGVVDLSPLDEVRDILYLGQLGVETGHVLADILLGKSVPSGKLTTTWAAWGEYPALGEFGDINETRYREGVYVGYRYFDTVGKKPLFPFGFGLGYTDFSLKAAGAEIEGETVTVKALVTNTGKFPGREVAQLYASSPAGKLDKPRQALAAFAKSRELQPGESEELTLRFAMRELASYDESRAAWVLEEGDYVLRLGQSSAETRPAALVRLEGEAVTLRARPCCGKPDFQDWRPEPQPAGKLHFVKVLHLSAADIPTETVNYDRDEPVDSAAAALSDEELAYMGVGAFSSGGMVASVIGSASQSVAGAAGETCGLLKDKGFPVLVMADGPAGLRLNKDYTVDEKGVHAVGQSLPEGFDDFLPAPVKLLTGGKKKLKPGVELRHQYCTAIPIGTALAQSWDPALAEACGDLVGDEMERFGIHLWLAPALNIHRDIRCGRNFEYFSEDPLISGKFAAAITRGVQKHPGCGTTIKHFAANNQETNRYYSNSQVSERAMREIYLRGFGIAVRESQPKALMTSYNLLNGRHTSERRDLMEDILRCEFGYEGLVMTDWIIAFGMQAPGSVYQAPDAGLIAAAGNDLTMPGGKGDVKAILKALGDGRLSRRQLEQNASRVLRIARELTGK